MEAEAVSISMEAAGTSMNRVKQPGQCSRLLFVLAEKRDQPSGVGGWSPWRCPSGQQRYGYRQQTCSTAQIPAPQQLFTALRRTTLAHTLVKRMQDSGR